MPPSSLEFAGKVQKLGDISNQSEFHPPSSPLSELPVTYGPHWEHLLDGRNVTLDEGGWNRFPNLDLVMGSEAELH